jgi:neopullulanase
MGADGWRLDVPNEIDDDAFWEDFRIVVKAANPEAYLVGEIWDGNPRWVGDKHFDGLMNYPVRDAVFEVLRGESSVTAFANSVEDLLINYPPENVNAMLVLLGSHDTRRIRRKFEDDMDRVKLAYFFPFVYPGAPCIYYGDEIGLDGGKDPDCRRAFPWDELLWDKSMRAWMKQLIQLRHAEDALRRGDLKRLSIEKNSYLFKRSTDVSELVVAMNFGEKEQKITIPAASFCKGAFSKIRDLVSGAEYDLQDGSYSVTLPRLSGAIYQGIR